VALATSEADQLRLIEKSLSEKYDGRVAITAIHDQVEGVATALRSARIRTYVPVLVRREVDERLRQLVRT